MAKAQNIMVLIDPKGTQYNKYKGATLLTPNKKEASLASQISIEDHDYPFRIYSQRLKDLCTLKYSIITLSEEGIALYDENLKIIPTVAKEVYDVTGAGDTVLASLGVALSSNLTI